MAALEGCVVGPRSAVPTSAATDGRADMVIVNAHIWTGVDHTGGSPSGPKPSALLIRDGKIAAIGTDLDVWANVDAGARVIDAKGRRVIPGITDSHTHIISGGFQLARLNLRDVRSREEFVRAIARDARSKKPGEWILGGRWTVESWPSPVSPTRHWIDPVTGDVPVFLSRMDGHQALANSAALKLAGINATGPTDPEGGEIERDPETGEPTGILKESAMGLVSRVIPAEAPAERYDEGEAVQSIRYEALLRAMRHANSLGVTSVHDMCSPGDLEAFRQAEADNALTVRITAYLSVTDWAAYADKFDSYGLNSEMVLLAGFKGYMDGSLGSRTAYMSEPYADATPDSLHPRGYLNAMADPIESFRADVALADARGLQVAVHAIGDEANHLLLDLYESVLRRGRPSRQPRHRVEHAQHLLLSDIPRFAELGVVASMQPLHKADDGRYAEKALGTQRLQGSYAFRQLVDSGALLVFGSDWPVVDMNPFRGIDAAVNARTLDGKVWLPSHSLTLEEALRSYTAWPPKAIHREDRLGTLEVGKYADLVILSVDPFSMQVEQVGDVPVDLTLVGGKVVYRREAEGSH